MFGGRGGVALHGTMFVEASLNEHLCFSLSSDMRHGHWAEKTHGQKFQKVENDENHFFEITSSKLFKS